MSQANGRTFVYVANSGSRELFVLEMDRESGDLTFLESVPFTGKATAPPATGADASQAPANPLAVSPDGRFLYAAARWEPYAVASFGIDPASGRLTHLGNAPLPDSMAFISTDRSGRILFGASYPGNKLSLSRIDANGLVQPAHQVVPTTPNPHSVRVDWSNRYVLAPSLGGNVVLQYRFDADVGTIAPNTPESVAVRPTAGPRHFVFHPNGRFVYLLNELDASVYAFAFDAAKGTLSELQTVSALPSGFNDPPAAADVHITPDGRFLYASVRASSTLAAFAVDSESGTLTPIGVFPTEERPRGFNIDPSGRFLLAVGQLSHRLSTYGIDGETGELTRLKDYAMGLGPNWVEFVDL